MSERESGRECHKKWQSGVGYCRVINRISKI